MPYWPYLCFRTVNCIRSISCGPHLPYSHDHASQVLFSHPLLNSLVLYQFIVISVTDPLVAAFTHSAFLASGSLHPLSLLDTLMAASSHSGPWPCLSLGPPDPVHSGSGFPGSVFSKSAYSDFLYRAAHSLPLHSLT